MSSVRIIIPYFGSLHEVFPFWYESARNNADIDFLFITDCEVRECTNIHVVRISLEGLKDRIEAALGMEVCLPKAYKLCDFRPAFGLIFSEELKGYDFWGFGDIDVVYGRLRDFITEEVLSSHDMVSCWGHLTLYRNCEYMNKLFQEKHEGEYLYYKDVFTNPDNQIFDELWRGTGAIMRDFHADRMYRCEKLIDDVVVPQIFKHFKSLFSRERKCMTFIYKDRNLFRVHFDSRFRRHVEPTMYAHFQKRNGWTIDVDDLSDYIIYPNVFRKPFRFMQGLKLAWLGSPRIIDYVTQKTRKT